VHADPTTQLEEHVVIVPRLSPASSVASENKITSPDAHDRDSDGATHVVASSTRPPHAHNPTTNTNHRMTWTSYRNNYARSAHDASPCARNA
jgi:hypothetical protein